MTSTGGIDEWLDLGTSGVSALSNRGHKLSIFPKKDSTFVSIHKNGSEYLFDLKGPTCSTSLKVNKNIPPSSFTDYELAQLFKSSKAGMIYLWSPHMELSINEMKLLSQQTFSKKITFLFDHQASPKLEEKLKGQGISSENFRRQKSHLLDSYNINAHYPSLVLYKNGKIVKMLPGMNGVPRIQELLKEIE